jgi:hypothetical protein
MPKRPKGILIFAKDRIFTRKGVGVEQSTPCPTKANRTISDPKSSRCFRMNGSLDLVQEDSAGWAPDL